MVIIAYLTSFGLITIFHFLSDYITSCQSRYSSLGT